MWKSIRKHLKLPKKFTKKQVPDKEIPDKEISAGQVPDEQVPDEQVPDEQVPDKEVVPDGEVPDEAVPDEEVSDEEVSDEEVSDEVPAKDKVRNNRFRILILGPANAGKTTLLERLTDSAAGAAIVTRSGRRIKKVPKGDDQRGIHSIDDEITYASNPDFVFHDSGGFEAGGVQEVEAVWQFIRKRSSASPSQQLHAIWLCIPTDNDRPLGFLQSGFFSKPTASVPVIGIFTKLDGRETKVMSVILGPDPSPSDFLDRAPEVEQKVAEFLNGLETRFRGQPYPPAGFIRVRNMDKVSEQSVASCNQLLQATMDALPDETQRSLLKLTVWKRNRRAHTVYVIKRVLKCRAKGNIVARTPQPMQDEESELQADEGFRILMELYGQENLYKYKGSDEKDEHDWLEWVYSMDKHHHPPLLLLDLGGLGDEDLDNGVKACVPFLHLVHHLPIASNPIVQDLVFICLVILWARQGRNADSPNASETEHTASLIQSQVNSELGDHGDWQGLDSSDTAKTLARIIDDYTPL